jgi:hypothetical protein
MSHTNPHLPSPVSPYASHPVGFAKVGGALGIASILIGFAIFFASCAGFDAALKLSIIPLLLALPGFVLTIVGGVWQKKAHIEDTHMLASIFLTLLGIMGALLEMSAWQGWKIFQ